MNTRLVTIHYGELALKGRNRSYFEGRLVNNVRAKLQKFDVKEVRRLQGRVLIEFKGEVVWENVKEKLRKVFGFSVASPVYRTDVSLGDVEKELVSAVANLQFDSFAVKTKRANKNFNLTSPEISSKLGAVIQGVSKARVDLKNPEITFYVDILDNEIFFTFERFRGPGGLPVGVSGNVFQMLSGGIDSPVAAWMMMKRGLKVGYIHFHSRPFTDDQSVEKVEELAEELTTWQNTARFISVPFGEVQKKIVTNISSRYRVVLYRRFMVRIASRLAKDFGGEGLVTGEALGQVASQTLSNLATVEAASLLPILRPLVGMDKQEIVDLARKIGTYELSIVPHRDCCSFLMPPDPIIRTTPDELLRVEGALDVEGLVDEAIRGVEVRELGVGKRTIELLGGVLR